jgi:uncharacterized protein YraI
MLHSHIRKLQVFLCLLLVSVLGALSLRLTLAQNATPVGYGSVTVGKIAADSTQSVYSFNGSAGDLVTIQVVGTAPNWQPTLSLMSPDQQQPLVTSAPADALDTLMGGAQLVYRLQQTGTYMITVQGQPGDFLLTLASRPAVNSAPLTLNSPLDVTLPLTQPNQSFVFNTDPAKSTTLLISAAPAVTNASIEIRNGAGQLVSVQRGNLDNACVSFGPGDEVDEVTVAAGADTTGKLTLTLSNAPCQLGQAPVQAVATPQFTPLTIAGVCAASTFHNVNIRSGPSTGYSIVSLLPARTPIQVVGISDNAGWYAVKNNFISGWISAAVVSVAGECSNLPVIPSPALPTASPTPGLPVVTVVVTVVSPVTVTASPTVAGPSPTAVSPTAPAPTETAVPPTATPEAPTLTPTVTPG